MVTWLTFNNLTGPSLLPSYFHTNINLNVKYGSNPKIIFKVNIQKVWISMMETGRPFNGLIVEPLISCRCLVGWSRIFLDIISHDMSRKPRKGECSCLLGTVECFDGEKMAYWRALHVYPPTWMASPPSSSNYIVALDTVLILFLVNNGRPNWPSSSPVSDPLSGHQEILDTAPLVVYQRSQFTFHYTDYSLGQSILN